MKSANILAPHFSTLSDSSGLVRFSALSRKRLMADRFSRPWHLFTPVPPQSALPSVVRSFSENAQVPSRVTEDVTFGHMMRVPVVKSLYEDDSLSLRLLSRYRTSMSVTKFIPPACEIQSLYANVIRQVPSKYMLRGTRVHKKLEDERMGLPDPPDKPLEPFQSKAASVFRSAECFWLLSRGVTVNEVQLAGKLGSKTLRGVVDIITAKVDRHGQLNLSLGELKTTNRLDRVESSFKRQMARNQVLVYFDLLTQMLLDTEQANKDLQWDKFIPEENESLEMRIQPLKLSERHISDVLTSFPVHTLKDAYRFASAGLEALKDAKPKINKIMTVTFSQSMHKQTVLLEPFDRHELEKMVEHRSLLFRGKREPIPYVPSFESTRICSGCQYKPGCAQYKRDTMLQISTPDKIGASHTPKESPAATAAIHI